MWRQLSQMQRWAVAIWTRPTSPSRALPCRAVLLLRGSAVQQQLDAPATSDIPHRGTRLDRARHERDDGERIASSDMLLPRRQDGEACGLEQRGKPAGPVWPSALRPEACVPLAEPDRDELGASRLATHVETRMGSECRRGGGFPAIRASSGRTKATAPASAARGLPGRPMNTAFPSRPAASGFTDIMARTASAAGTISRSARKSAQ